METQPLLNAEGSTQAGRAPRRNINIIGVAKDNRSSVVDEYGGIFGALYKGAKGKRVSLDLPPTIQIHGHSGLSSSRPRTDIDKSVTCLIPTKHGQPTGVGSEFEIVLVEQDPDDEEAKKFPPQKLGLWRELIARRTSERSIELRSRSSRFGDSGPLALSGVESRSIPRTNDPDTNRPHEYFCSPRFAVLASGLRDAQRDSEDNQAGGPSTSLMNLVEAPTYDRRESFSLLGVRKNHVEAVATFVESLLPPCSGTFSRDVSLNFDGSHADFASHRELAGFNDIDKTIDPQTNMYFFPSPKPPTTAKGVGQHRELTSGENHSNKRGVFVVYSSAGSDRPKSSVDAFTGVYQNPRESAPMLLSAPQAKGNGVNTVRLTPNHSLSTFQVPGTTYRVYAWLPEATLSSLASRGIKPEDEEYAGAGDEHKGDSDGASDVSDMDCA